MICDNHKTLKLKCFLNYQGRSELRYTHTLAFDTDKQDQFLFDNVESKEGLEQAIEMINTEINTLLSGKTVREPADYDERLHEFEAAKTQNGKKCYNVIKACSEAILLAIGNCYAKGMAYHGLRRS